MPQVPASPKKIQEEEVKYKSAISEATMTKLAGSINYLLQAFFPVGTILMTMLDEATFQSEVGAATGNWELCDGGTAVGTEYETLTGFSSKPDLRDRYPRGKGNGAGLNPDGDLALGAHQADIFKSHYHDHVYFREDPPFNSSHHRYQKGAGDATLNVPTDYTGGAETRPLTTIVNFMVRLD